MDEIGTGKNFPPQHPGLAFRFISYIIVNILVIPLMWIFMKLLNRTRFTGKENLADVNPPWILMSNHLTILDDLFIDPLIFFPKGMLGYRYIPYHAPEENNFYRSRFPALFMRYVKSIPLIRGRGFHQEGINRLIEAVKDGGMLHIFPEGTRTRTGEIGKGKHGIGRIVYETGATVIPAYHEGLEKVLPIGSGIPRIFKDIRIAIGEPITFEEELKLENNINTWKEITSKIMDGIHQQKTVVAKKWGERTD